MKEKIQLLSRGVFEYENPNIEISEKEIELEVEFGSRYTGAIQLNSRNHIEIRAMVFSSNKWMQFSAVDRLQNRPRFFYISFHTKKIRFNNLVDNVFAVV